MTDDVDQAQTEAGDLLEAIREGSLAWESVGTLAGVVSSGTPVRDHIDGITVFKSLGIGLLDVAVAAVVYEQAIARGLGTRIDTAGHEKYGSGRNN